MMLRHLLWKDTMVVRPLIVAIVIGIVVINATILLLTLAIAGEASADIFVSFWALMPNLVALGAPALLIGGEEESGTLAWLRTLPVSWKRLADSKFLVGIGAVVLAWLASSLVLMLMLAVIGSPAPGRFGPSAVSTHYADSMLSVGGICYLMFFSTLLLICGFVTAYLFRSPVAGLVAVVPLICLANLVSLELGRRLRSGDLRYAGLNEDLTLAGDWPLIAAGIALLIAGWFAQRLLACRRLTWSQSDTIKNLTAPDPVSAYRPPAVVGASRPSMANALLWQHWRQMGWLGTVLTLAVAFFTIILLVELPVESTPTLRFLEGLAPGVIALGASWIGALAFYGDNVRRRSAFFADRGVAPTDVWITRLALPVACCLLLVAVVAIIAGYDRSLDGVRSAQRVGIAVMIVVMFAFGQLVSQWTKRPVLSFFAAPAFTLLTCTTLLWLFAIYPKYQACAVLVAPALLFASWRLSGRWLAGRIDRGYHWRVVAYSLLAVALPLIAVPALRIWSTPSPMLDWESRVMAIQRTAVQADPIAYQSSIAPDAVYGAGSSNQFVQATTSERIELLKQELSSDRIGDHVALDDVDLALESLRDHTMSLEESDELLQMTVSVLLKWDRTIRQGAIHGTHTLWELETIADPSERRAVAALSSIRQPSPEIIELIKLLPDAEMRKQSRRNALITAWRSYRSTRWRRDFAGHTYWGKSFAQYNVCNGLSRVSFERTRCDRYVDRLTRLMLDQIDNGLPVSTADSGYQRRNEIWTEISGVRHHHLQTVSCPIGTHWTAGRDEWTDRLKAAHAE